MIKLVESLKLPKRVKSLVNSRDLRDYVGEDYDLANAECVPTYDLEEVKKAYDNDQIVLVVQYDYNNDIVIPFFLSKEYTRADVFNRLKDDFIEGYIFTNLKPLADIRKARAKNQDTRNYKISKGQDWYTRGTDKSHYNLTHDEYFDKSGYRVDMHKYIDKLNAIKRISRTFEQKLIDISNEYADLLEIINKKEMDYARQSIFLDTTKNLYSYEIREIKEDIIKELGNIGRDYRDYVELKKNLQKLENSDRENVEEEKKSLNQMISEKERNINTTFDELKAKIRRLKERYVNITSSALNRNDIEESKKILTKVFEAVSSKFLTEIDGFKVYTKPFTKSSIQHLSRCEEYQVPRKFSNFTYLIVHPEYKGFLLIGNTDKYVRGYDSYKDTFYDYTINSKLVDVLYQLYNDFDSFIWEYFVLKQNGYIKYIDTKEKLLLAVKAASYCSEKEHLLTSIIETDLLKKFKLDNADIADLLRKFESKDFTEYVLNNGLFNNEVVSNLEDADYNTIWKILSYLPEKTLKKTIQSIDPNKNSRLFLMVLEHFQDWIDYVTQEQVVAYFRKKIINNKGYYWKFYDNIKTLLKKFDYPKDVKIKMLQILRGSSKRDDHTELLDFKRVY